jgi:dTDP-4-amino-4,6-dideoxygalactose transaminase
VLGTKSLGASTRVSHWPRIDDQARACFPTSGRVSILQALRAIGLGPGDRMLVPTYHCPTMIEPCVLLGAEPLFYPIGADGAPRLDALRHLDTRGVKVLIAAHLFGLPIDLTGVREYCDKRGLWFIEDCAHAYFGRSSVAPVGTTGDLVIGSLPKFFPAVEGGCLVVRTASLAVPRLSGPGLVAELRTVWDCLELGARSGRLGMINGLVAALAALKTRVRGAGKAAPADAGAPADAAAALSTIIPSRTGQRTTAALRWVIRHLDVDRSAAQRRSNYLQFARLLGSEALLRPLFPILPEGAVPYVFPVWVDNPEQLYQALRQRGVPLFRWDIVWPGTPVLEGDAGTSWSTQVFQLCCHEDMSTDDVDAVARTVKEECQRICR